MKLLAPTVKLAVLAGTMLLVTTGCESTGGGGGSVGMYYGVGFYDSWYHGGYCDDPDVIVTPPDRPDSGPRPEHPIVKPPAVSPQPRPMPSIPATPRAAPRGGGRR